MKNGKSTLIMTIDIGIWYIFYGATLTDYFNYEFYNSNACLDGNIYCEETEKVLKKLLINNVNK